MFSLCYILSIHKCLLKPTKDSFSISFILTTFLISLNIDTIGYQLFWWLLVISIVSLIIPIGWFLIYDSQSFLYCNFFFNTFVWCPKISVYVLFVFSSYFVFSINQLLTSSLYIIYLCGLFNGVESGVFGLIILKSKILNSSNASFTSWT